MKRPRSLRSIALTRLVAVVALTATAFIASTAFAATPTVSVGSLARGVGEQGPVSVRASDLSGSGLGAWTIDITYDPSVVSVKSCDPQHGGLCNPAYRENEVRTNGVQLNGLTGNVTLATINFTCNSVGTSPLTVSLSVFADTTAGGPQPITADVSNGSVTCTAQPTQPPALLGDVDCDHDVDSIDAAFVLQYDAGLIDGLPCFTNGDLNHDGHVNSIDGTIILQIAAGLI